MATCPRCKGHLTDNHRCPRRSYFVAAEVIVAAVAGGAAGLLLVILFDPSGRHITDAESAISIAVGEAARSRFARRPAPLSQLTA